MSCDVDLHGWVVRRGRATSVFRSPASQTELMPILGIEHQISEFGTWV
jgi:hypothetical protein